MSTKLVVPGVEVDASQEEVDATAKSEFDVTIKTHHAVRVGAITRGEGKPVEIPVAEDEMNFIAELEFEDGTRQWTPVETLRERLARTERSFVTKDEVHIPVTVSGYGTRGVGDWALQGSTPGNCVATRGVQPGHGTPARAMAAYYENKLKPEPGLYAIDRQGHLIKQPEDAILPAGEIPTWCCCTAPSARRAPALAGFSIRPIGWNSVTARTRIVGLNHRTLSESPAQNALALVKQLPANARLHLLTHSRGGLVGELLALGSLPSEAVSSLERAGRPEEEIKALRELSALLHEKQVRVDVLCVWPARRAALSLPRNGWIATCRCCSI